ncbi:phage terminase large subunit [uncultured Pseudacidovorax sp.]|uniref:phage terminase large subunit n=1 Tax=uncultured Pseudacidovorax sp. TaxID=679313 RepID=UPI0025F1CBFC|nr:phage terminase large subunit [uncultured Pseudacidovorax sp.]
MARRISLLAFFLMWAERQRWEVPDVHVRACVWLEHRGELAVLRCFRGFGKSTILAVYNAWRFHGDLTYRILHQSESDPTAYKTSRDTKNVMNNHPLTRNMIREGEVEQWWVHGSTDARNASMFAKGILSNVTSARADECQNDDVEVPRNIQTPEAREKLRYRLGEQTHILVPGGKKLYIGTPHTHDSLYDEQERKGADCLTIRMFEQERRCEKPAHEVDVGFAPDYVFVGIGAGAQLLAPDTDYQVVGGRVSFTNMPAGVVDFYAGCAWPERFTRAELLKRRRETRTLNEWDSQYQLHSKPIGEVRLDPERIVPYDCMPVLRTANRETVLMLGDVQMVSAACRWDCSLGKIDSDASAISLVYTDLAGRLYWQFAIGLTGDADEQCQQVRALVLKYQIPSVTIETNGPGGFMPPILRKHLAGRGVHGKPQEPITCGVVEDFASTNKNKDILDAFEAPMSIGALWAHVDVLDGPTWDQMKDWNPAETDQPDDYLDSGARAIRANPIRIGRGHSAGNSADRQRAMWRPSSGVHEVTLEA